MSYHPPKLKVKANIQKNRIYFTFTGKVTKQEMDNLYTDTRFCVADMSPGFDVISDYSDCSFLHITSISPFRKIMTYLITNNVGEIVRIVNKKSLLYRQILNLSSMIYGYRPIYVSTLEEAEAKLENLIKRNGIRIHVNKLPVEYIANNTSQFGTILNISITGCAVESKKTQPSLDEEISIIMLLNNQPDTTAAKFTIKSRVTRVDNESFGVHFEGLDDEQKEKLWKHLIHESKREI